MFFLSNESDPVIFTSLCDDQIIGDTNHDEDASSPKPGDWGRILIDGNQDEISIAHVIFKYGGKNYGVKKDYVLIVQNARSCTMTDVVFENSMNGLLAINSEIECDECRFANNLQFPITLEEWSAVRFPSHNEITANGVQGIGLRGGIYDYSSATNVEFLLEPARIDSVDYPYIPMGWTIHENIHLRVMPGVIFKEFPDSGNILVQGSIACEGSLSSPIIFSSIDDDEFGGDTENNGPPQGKPAISEGKIYLDHHQNEESRFRHVIFQYRREGVTTSVTNTSSLIFESCQWWNCDFGLRVSSFSQLSIQDCHWSHCVKEALNVGGKGITTISASSFYQQEGTCVHAYNTPFTMSGCSFELASSGEGMTLYDIQASINHCSFEGGKTGIQISGISDVQGSNLNFRNQTDGIHLQSGETSITHSTFLGNQNRAIWIEDKASSTIQNNLFAYNYVGVYLNINITRYPNLTAIVHQNDFFGNSYAVSESSSQFELDAINNYWGHASGPTVDADSIYGDRIQGDILYEPFLTRQYTEITQPIASFQAPEIVNTGDLVQMDGSASHDPDGLAIEYHWLLMDRPSSSRASLIHDISPICFFVPDVAGTYRVRLYVDNGATPSFYQDLEILAEGTFSLDDQDGDGIIYAMELALGTNPNQGDSDHDGLLDGEEVYDHKTDPASSDTDGDGLDDGLEIALGLNPLETDSDGDGIPDGQAYQNLDHQRIFGKLLIEADTFSNLSNGCVLASGNVTINQALRCANDIVLNPETLTIEPIEPNDLSVLYREISIPVISGFFQLDAGQLAMNFSLEGITSHLEIAGLPVDINQISLIMGNDSGIRGGWNTDVSTCFRWIEIPD